MKTLGEVACKAYFTAVKMPMPSWDGIDKRARDAWEATARAVIKANEIQSQMVYAVVYLADDDVSEVLCSIWRTPELADIELDRVNELGAADGVICYLRPQLVQTVPLSRQAQD